ncbi:IPT/TIG domain-containing protein [Streptomyces sp. DSM 41524]|uniref:IPT/TIG domain-containing protein n=1 Tax=Streptomyces asiaticus subsp. ignotus TaxID=3098222 RepID=A0ABU7QCR5_9ACTN|nr:IPT/TIG domain-containing protein [Streptomyces sp. DSM 41524]
MTWHAPPRIREWNATTTPSSSPRAESSPGVNHPHRRDVAPRCPFPTPGLHDASTSVRPPLGDGVHPARDHHHRRRHQHLGHPLIDCYLAPTITSMVPPTGTAGDQITIIGTAFVNVDTVTAIAVFTPVNDTQLIATVPGGLITGTGP